MKRIVILMTLLAMVLGAGMSYAADLQATGTWRVWAQWQSDLDMLEEGDAQADGDSEEEFNVYQRLRVAFHFVANENLKAVWQLEVGSQDWGDNAAGVFAIGADQTGVIEVKHAYIQFVWPNSEVATYAGLMSISLPGSGTGGTPILSNDTAGLIVQTPIGDYLTATAGWARALDLENAAGNGDLNQNDNGVATQDYLDVAFLILNLDFDGIALTPYFAYAYAGDDFFADLNNVAAGNNLTTDYMNTAAGVVPGLLAVNGTLEDVTDQTQDLGFDIWYGGLVLDLTLFDPLNITAAFHYGSLDSDTQDSWDRSGWVADLSIEYTGFDFITPELFFAYSTGEDGNGTDVGDNDGREDGSERIPAISSAYGPTSVWFTGFWTGEGIETYDSDNKYGFWTIGLFLKNFTFLENLSHNLHILYIEGTNDDDVGTANNLHDNTVAYTNTLTEDDSIWEFDFMTDYSIYDELTARLVLGYLAVDMDDDNWTELAGDFEEDDVFVLQLGLRYDF